MGESEKRKQRFQRLFQRLSPISAFSKQQARESCSDLSPHFVAMALKDLVREGILDRYETSEQETFAWRNAQVRVDPSHWIERQVSGSQVMAQPQQERPRERLLAHGAEQLNDAELLAILIRVGVKGESAIEAGRRLANSYAEKLSDLRRSGKEELRRVSPAVTVTSYAAIMAGIELGRRVARHEQLHRASHSPITSTHMAVQYCNDVFSGLAISGVQEEFHIVTLSTKHLPINTHLITRGTLDASLVHPREVFRPAIRDSASAVILVHNHPSGDASPSREDLQVTDRLTEAGKLLGISVLDHIVVASEGSISIRETS
ncbi:DNA repair protein RadC [Stieleria sp. TO1_6]|uniref:RadC family protein n=1 Tax=Stieleria tagensis TaxID=2956795 RepID=UPI00209B9554|nr:DNA repair protein RadC [Stieleria tagensis]MCO8121488.1 DNA repair protein RadC [Stieleria tagensis]